MKKYIGDIGGNGIRWKIKLNNKIINEGYFPTIEKNKDDVVWELAKKANDFGIDAILLSAPGAINTETGEVRGQTGIEGFRYFNLYDQIRNKLKNKNTIIKATNDANAALLGAVSLNYEIKYAIQITIGTGIGGAIYNEGNILFGASGFGGEFGYFPMFSETDKSYQIASSVCSANALVNMFNGKYKNAKEIFAKEWDSIEVNAWFSTLAKFIFGLNFAIDPEVIFIDGGVTNDERFLSRVQKETNKLLKFINLPEKIDIKKSSLGENAALIGAEMLVKD